MILHARRARPFVDCDSLWLCGKRFCKALSKGSCITQSVGLLMSMSCYLSYNSCSLLCPSRVIHPIVLHHHIFSNYHQQHHDSETSCAKSRYQLKKLPHPTHTPPPPSPIDSDYLHSLSAPDCAGSQSSCRSNFRPASLASVVGLDSSSERC